MNEDGTINEEKSIEDIPQDMPDREKIIEAFKTCKDESNFYFFFLNSDTK